MVRYLTPLFSLISRTSVYRAGCASKTGRVGYAAATLPVYLSANRGVVLKIALLTPLVLLLAGTGNASSKAPQVSCKERRKAIVFYRTATWKWEDRRYVARTKTAYAEQWVLGCKYLRSVAKLWVVRSKAARRLYYATPTDPRTAIRMVFGRYADQALSVAGCETGGTYSVYASNGQYLGLFQMGDYARGRYGHGTTAIAQARAAYRYFSSSGYDWSPWECKP